MTLCHIQTGEQKVTPPGRFHWCRASKDMKDVGVPLARAEFPAMTRLRLLPDFVFLDDQGSTHSSRDVLGDFTVLAFTHCDEATHGPAADALTAVVAENRGVNGMDVRGIDIHWSDARCQQHDTCHLVGVQAHVLVLCDATGAIHRLYGVGHEDRFFVIGPNCHVIDSASVRDVARLALQLSLDVALCTDGTARARPRELGAGHAGDSRPTAERETPGTQPRIPGGVPGQGLGGPCGGTWRKPRNQRMGNGTTG